VKPTKATLASTVGELLTMASTRRAYAALALATAADRVLGRAALGVLLMHAFGYDARDGGACFAEGPLGGSGGVCHAGRELVEAALNAARVTQ